MRGLRCVILASGLALSTGQGCFEDVTVVSFQPDEATSLQLLSATERNDSVPRPRYGAANGTARPR